MLHVKPMVLKTLVANVQNLVLPTKNFSVETMASRTRTLASIKNTSVIPKMVLLRLYILVPAIVSSDMDSIQLCSHFFSFESFAKTRKTKCNNQGVIKCITTNTQLKIQRNYKQ